MLRGDSRRFFLGAFAAALSGAASSHWLRRLAAEQPSTEDPPVKQVILLWLDGGPATIDLWDLKPDHQNGGPFQEIRTRTPGTRISEHLPKLAEWTEQMAIIRSMSSQEGDHGRATHLARTGYSPQAGIEFPDLGALVAKETGGQDGFLLPRFVSIAPPENAGFAGSGFLGPNWAPMSVGKTARSVSDLTVGNLEPIEAVRGSHLQNLELLRQFDGHFLEAHPGNATLGYRAAAEQAMKLMQPATVAAFDLEQEPEPLRQRYGRTVFGQGCLLARRLIERDVSFAEVTLDGWDTHQDNFSKLVGLSQQLDQAFSALLSDLADRGLLDSTLIVCQGEFGRTPAINGSAGRDHWPHVYSLALAGGGVGRGQLIGKTNAAGTRIESDWHGVPDLLATICRVTGIDPAKQHLSNVGRPIRVADAAARPIEALL